MGSIPRRAISIRIQARIVGLFQSSEWYRKRHANANYSSVVVREPVDECENARISQKH